MRKTLKIGRVNDADFEACDVDLQSVLVWAIREQRLHCCGTEDLEFNVKLDGRPLGGECINNIFVTLHGKMYTNDHPLNVRKLMNC